MRRVAPSVRCAGPGMPYDQLDVMFFFIFPTFWYGGVGGYMESNLSSGFFNPILHPVMREEMRRAAPSVRCVGPGMPYDQLDAMFFFSFCPYILVGRCGSI